MVRNPCDDRVGSFTLSGVRSHLIGLRRLLLVALLAAVAVAPALVIAPSASGAACSDVDVVFARGTGERPGTGIVGGPFVRAVTAQLPGRSVSSYAVNYPAAFNQNAGPGATDLVNHVRSVAASCPGTRFVLGGYSQGATVVDIALGIRVGYSQGTALPANLAPKVAAVVVYGNPIGAQGRTIAREAPTYAARTVEYCNSNDSVCGRSGTTSGSHTSYPTNGTIDSGARFAAGRVTSGA